MRIVTIVIALLSVGCAHAQQYFITLNIIPKSGTGTASQVNLWNGANTYYLGMVAPSLAASATLTMPAPTGTPGCVQDSTGAGILVISACGLVPPVVLSGNTAGTIFTTTQNGNGTAGSFVANGTGGALTVNSQTGVAAYVTSQSGSTYTMEAINYGSGAAFYGTSGGAVFSGISTGGNVFYGTGSAFPVVYVTQTGGGVSAIDAVATSGAAVYGTASTGYGVQGQATGSGVGGWFSSSSGYALEAVGTSYLTGTVTFGASLSGTHAQNVGTGDGPSFTGMTATSAGASIRDTSLAYGIVETDTGGGCNVGTAYAGGIGCSSDARLKRDVSDLAPALDGMMRLRPVDFRWIGNGRQGVGFIAQEAQEIVPQLVTSENGYLQMSYAGLVPYIVKAIQEMQKEIETAKK